MDMIRCALLLAGLVAGLLPGVVLAGEPPSLILGATNNMSSISAFVGVEKGLFLKHGDRFIKEAMREHPELFADLPRVP